MKVSTRVVSGYAVFLALLSAVLTYQTIVIHQMRSINRDLSSVSFQAALSSVQLIRDRDLVEEYSKKFFVSRDPDYLARLREYQRDFETTLGTIRSKARSANEQAAIIAPDQYLAAIQVGNRRPAVRPGTGRRGSFSNQPR